MRWYGAISWRHRASAMSVTIAAPTSLWALSYDQNSICLMDAVGPTPQTGFIDPTNGAPP
jgi:hypothetical protein